MTEYEAYRNWHRQDRIIQDTKRQLRSIQLDIEGLEWEMFQSLIRQYAQDKAFGRALRNFTGHTQYGWELACGVDYRLIKLTRRIGWDKMYELIRAVRRFYQEGE